MVTPPPSDSLSSLTSREREVLSLIAAGLSTAQIADRLHRSQRTIETHRHALGRKLGARNRVELAHIAIRNGLYGPVTMDDEHFDGTMYREALAAGRAGCWAWDLEQNALTMNETMGELIGTDVGEPIPASSLLEQIPGDDRKLVRQHIADVLEGRADCMHVRYRFELADGRQVELLSRGRCWPEDGPPRRISGVTILLSDASDPAAGL